MPSGRPAFLGHNALLGDGSYVENRPSKLQRTWDILGPYITAPVTVPINWTRNMFNASPYTLLTDTGPRAQALAEGGAEVATNVVGGSNFVSRPANSLAAGAATPKRMTQLPSLRDLPVNKAVSIARKEPHLIPSPDRSEGAFVGGPRTIQDRKDLLAMRRELDKTVARDPRGGDWYDRYRASVNEVTGGDLRDNLWMTNIQGQYSAGVSPQAELAFALKDTNSAIATGMPVKAARPAQQQASMRAIANNDPTEFQLGAKTGEYARRVNPDQPGPATATGVNDFRHARNLGYTEPDGTPQRNALSGAQHTFSDYETALAVDRANRKNLAGRNNWTGEQLQAVPWVVQKADDLWSRQSAGYISEARSMLKGGTQQEIEQAARELAFQDANKTIGDFFPKHTAYATYEAQPGAMTGHLPGSVGAPGWQRDLYANDTRSAWNTAPGGRDALYAGMRLNNTGYGMRVRPTLEMQGMYTPPGGATEFNPGNVARPLVAFQSGDVKSLPAADRALLNGVEATRAYLDAQGAGAWHKPWTDGAPGQSNSIFVTKRSPGVLDPAEMQALQKIGAQAGLPDIVDVNEGVTLTSFYPEPIGRSPKQQKALAGSIANAGDYRSIERAKVDSGYIGYEKAWEQQGQGGATRKLLRTIDDLPRATQQALDNNPAIPQGALARLERDQQWSNTWGATRADIQNARQIIGEGPGWIGRLRMAVRRKEILPAIATALIASSAMQEGGDER